MTTPNSFSGSAQATTLTGTGIGASDTTFTVASVSTWKETIGSNIGSYLGASGNFVVTIDYGTSSEEKVLCSGPITSTTINVVTRGYDGATPGTGVAHSAGAVVVHTISTDVPNQSNLGVTNAAAAQSTANTAVTNAATAQSTANTAQTTALGTQLSLPTGKNPFSGTVPSTPTQLRTFGWTMNVTAASAGTTITLPNSLFTSALLSVVGTNANESAGPGAYCTVKSIGITSFTVYIYTAGGTKATSGTYQFNFMVSGY
jgi:hypothetical protein